MSANDRQCPECSRIYRAGDWQEETCPFCDLPLKAIDTTNNILSDTISLQLHWPRGEREVIIGEAKGYLDAQVLKAALESEGIPVLLQGETASQAFGIWVGDIGRIQIFVPESRAEEARSILKITE